MTDTPAFFAEDMQLVRAKAVKVVLAAVQSENDPTAVMATIFDHSPLFAAVVDATDNLAAWAGTLAVVAAELADLLAGEEFISVESLLQEAMQLTDPEAS